MGSGQTRTMSSREITFVADRRLETGTLVEISVAWPVLLDEHVRLRLFLDGCVVRSEGRAITARFSKYNFRTRGTRALRAQPAEWIGNSAESEGNPCSGAAASAGAVTQRAAVAGSQALAAAL